MNDEASGQSMKNVWDTLVPVYIVTFFLELLLPVERVVLEKRDKELLISEGCPCKPRQWLRLGGWRRFLPHPPQIGLIRCFSLVHHICMPIFDSLTFLLTSHWSSQVLLRHILFQILTNFLTYYWPNQVFLAALAALYLTLVSESVTGCHFRILTQIVTFDTSNPSDISSEWCLDKKT